MRLILSTLADAAVIKAPLSMKPFYDEVLKNEDKTDYKKPLELLLDEYQAVVPKTNWNFNVKYSLFINMAAADKPICLCHLLLYVACKLKVFRCIWNSYSSLQDGSCNCQLSPRKESSFFSLWALVKIAFQLELEL